MTVPPAPWAKGYARRVRLDLTDMQAFADLINRLGAREAYAIGRLKDGLPDRVRIVIAARLAGAKGDPNVIARTKEHIVFVEGEPAIFLIDIDMKAMPEAARARIREARCLGGPLRHCPSARHRGARHPPFDVVWLAQQGNGRGLSRQRRPSCRGRGRRRRGRRPLPGRLA